MPTPGVPKEVVQSQQQMTTINILEPQNKIHLDPQIKKEWQKTGDDKKRSLSRKIYRRNYILESNYNESRPIMRVE